MFFICFCLFRPCACTFPGEKPPAAVLQRVLQRGQQQLLHWRSHSGGFGGLMLSRTRFCFWCYLQVILTISKLLLPCTSLSQCLVHWTLQISSCIRSLCNIKQSCVVFEDWGLKTARNVSTTNQKRGRGKPQCWSPNHQCLPTSLLVVSRP